METTQSPLPKKIEVKEEGTKSLCFQEIIIELLAGKKIRRLGWEDIRYHVKLDNDVLKLHKTDGKLYEWIISKEDLSGDDYVIL